MKFLQNTDQAEIENALLSGQSKIVINDIELILQPLKRDTLKNKEREAKKIAANLVKLL